MLPLRPSLMIADRYRLEARLGAGGMSEVWRAHDLMLGRLVAVKVLSASLLASASSRDLLRREARAMAQLGHPNVASIFDYGKVTLEGTTLPYLVSKLLSRSTGQQRRGRPSEMIMVWSFRMSGVQRVG